MTALALQLNFHSDPGHGWLEVHRNLLVKLRNLGHDILPKISAYSYVSHDGDTLYLEEDCDAALFVDACKAVGWTFSIKDINNPRSDSFVRTLRRY